MHITLMLTFSRVFRVIVPVFVCLFVFLSAVFEVCSVVFHSYCTAKVTFAKNVAATTTATAVAIAALLLCS